jgi:hypothetical protein
MPKTLSKYVGTEKVSQTNYAGDIELKNLSTQKKNTGLFDKIFKTEMFCCGSLWSSTSVSFKPNASSLSYSLSTASCNPYL